MSVTCHPAAPTRLAVSLLALAAGTVAASGPALAVDPLNALVLSNGAALSYARDTPGDGGTLRIFATGEDFTVTGCVFDPGADDAGQLQCGDSASVVVANGSVPSALSAVSSRQAFDLLTDPITGTIWRYTFITGTGVHEYPNPIDGNSLRHPVALGMGGPFVYVIEGRLASGSDACGTGPCLSGQPLGVQRLTVGPVPVWQSFGDDSSDEPILPQEETHGLWVDEQDGLLWTVSGNGVGQAPRVLVYDIDNNLGGGDEVPQLVDAWAFTPRGTPDAPVGCDTNGDGAVSRTEEHGVDRPSLIAPLDGDRLLVGSRSGLSTFDRNGNFLGSVWRSGLSLDDVPTGLSQDAELLSLAVSQEHDQVFALFSTGQVTTPSNQSTAVLVRWSADQLPTASNRTIVADPDGGDVSTIAEAIALACTGDTVEIAAATWRESIQLSGKAIEVIARDDAVGEVIVQPPTNDPQPALAVLFTGAPGVRVDGLVLTGGTGQEVNLVTPLGNEIEATFGGGVFVAEGWLELSRTLVHGNSAQAGAGIGAVGARQLLLENVGVYRNVAEEFGGGLMLQDSDMQRQPRFTAGFMTLTQNESKGSPSVGGAIVMVGAEVEAHSVVVTGNGESPIVSGILGQPEAFGCVAWSNVENDGDGLGSLVDDCAGDQLGTLQDEDPLFLDPDNSDEPNFHLGEGSPSVDAGAPDGPDDEDGSRADQGMYGGEAGDWYPQDFDPGDDDDSAADDDDDDDDVEDDDDDDDDSAEAQQLPSGLRCGCEARIVGGVAPPGLGGTSLALTLLLIGASRRRRRES